MSKPFPETAEELLTKARPTTSPVKDGSYGYFIAKTRQMLGNPDAARACSAYWERAHSPRYEAGADIHLAEGVSSWETLEGKRIVRVVARDAQSGQLAPHTVDSFDA